jgi:hypothetical protein
MHGNHHDVFPGRGQFLGSEAIREVGYKRLSRLGPFLNDSPGIFRIEE